jgi:hypothetical protein
MLPIVDVHAHYHAHLPESFDNFRRLVDSPELHRVVVCALNLKLAPSEKFHFMHNFATTNEQLAAFVEKLASPKIVPFAHIEPRDADAPKQVEYWIRERGMRGIKLYPPMGWYPNEPRVLPTFQAADALGVPVLMHMGRVAPHPGLRSIYARPILLEDVGLACPKLTLIIGHFGCPWQWEAARLADGFSNFFFDLTTSGSLDLQLIKAVAEDKSLGLRRLLLGTDAAGLDNLQRAKATLDRLRGAGFTETQLDAIAHHNGLAALGLSASG